VITIALLLTGCSRQERGSESGGAGTGTRVVLLGTGTPNAEPERAGSSIAIVVDSTVCIVDAGPGVVRRANAARQNGFAALAPSNLKRLFVTHLHSDHTLGLPDLIFTPWVLDRTEPLDVYGPEGIAEMTRHIEAAWREDIRNRLEGLEPANRDGYRVNVHEIEAGLVFEDELIRVIAFEVQHGAWEHAFGYRFETPDRVIVISGDTIPTETLIEHARGCDVLVHEVYSRAGFEGRSPVWQRYHAASHTSTVELAGIARQTQPGLLILTHQLLWGATPEELLHEITSRYSGRVVYGRDLDVY
jgi:ribonuclease BN (tRNA processing enzyme)